MNIKEKTLDKTIEKAISEDREEVINEATAKDKAVESLINVAPKMKGKNSEVELKTDLTEADVCLHTQAAMLGKMIDLIDKPLEKAEELITDVIETKERKLLSKDRRSRLEIVEIAKSPETFMAAGEENRGFLSRFFKPKTPK